LYHNITNGVVKRGTNKWDAITQHLERLTIIFTCARRKNNKIRKKCFTTRKKSCRLPPTHLQLDVTGYCMQLKWSYVQLHLNFKWFLVTSLIMVQLVFLSSFKMDDFYILICANMLLYIQYHIYIWICTNTLPKNLSSKTRFGFLCLNQTMIPFILEEHILLISKRIWAIFVALNVLNVELKNILEAKKQ
jgi:hypothetical protein